ncbi:MAG: 6-phosphogluconolactonase [Propionibacteriaceae bacterium]|nr:6-phosphogluconolactonase [Propionibacteriaceae bacterium]
MRVHRYSNPEALCHGVADALVSHATTGQRALRLCLSDGLSDICSVISTTAADTAKMRRLDLWWSNDRFVDVTDPTRVSTRTLAALGGLRLTAAHIHPMPTPSGNADVDAAAIAYAAELGDTAFDLTVLMVGSNGRVAGVKAGSPTFLNATPHAVIGVRDSDGECLTLSLATLARSSEIWFIAIGEAAASLVPRIVDGDETLPAGVLRGRRNTKLFVDEKAAGRLPRYVCEL